MGVLDRGPTWPDHGQNQGKGRFRLRVVFAPQVAAVSSSQYGYVMPRAAATTYFLLSLDKRCGAPPKSRSIDALRAVAQTKRCRLARQDLQNCLAINLFRRRGSRERCHD